jgi:hypothetical protein
MLEIKALNIEIKTITMGERKLTKSIFNQLEHKDCFNGTMDFIGEKLYGYVKIQNERFILWNERGKLKKTSITKYFNLIKVNFDQRNQDVASWFLNKCNIEPAESEDYRDTELRLDYNGALEYNSLIAKVKAFTSIVLDSQIFI